MPANRMKLLRVLTICVCPVLMLCTATPAAQSTAGSLSQIVLNVSPRQIVGQPLVSTARILLLDQNSDLVTDYDLAADPISLTTSAGSLTPGLLDDTALFSGGIVDFLSVGVRYLGESGPVSLTAANSSISSADLIVSFSGYDILGATDLFGGGLVSVYSSLPTSIRVRVRNGGDMTAVDQPSLKAFFASGGGSVKIFFNPRANGIEDTLTVGLPTEGLAAGEDTLVLVLQSRYRPADSVLATADTLRLPITVRDPVDFSLVAGSLKPDSVYAGVSFNMAFDVAATGFVGPIDSTHVTIRLVSPFDTVHALLFDGPLMPDSFTTGVISYSGVPAFIDSGLGYPPGTYAISLVHTLVSESSIITLSDWGTDSLHLLPSVALQYVAGSFRPVEIASGQEVSFEFEFYLDGSQSMLLEPSGSSFGIAGPGFIATTNLIVDGDSLLPGINQVASERVYIPVDQLDEMLTPTASLVYRHRGAANELLFETFFDGQLVAVAASPVVQIIETWIVAPNAPNMNTGQEFQISCRIANLSISDQDPFPVRMVTNGGSIFEGDKTIAGIPGGDTISISYDVVASVSRNSAEIFRIDIASDDVNQLSPLDNIALATIQEPAMLSLEHFLLGAEQGYVNVNDEFNLVISLVNAGEAAVSSGRFRITTEGFDDSTPDTLIEAIEVGTPLSIAFVAPPHDTTVSIDFVLIERPLDLNTNGPAQIGDTAFERQLVVTSLEARLLAEAEVVTSNLVLEGAEKELFRLSLTNQGSGAISDIRLKSVALVFTDRMNLPLDVRSVLELGNTGFYDGDSRVARAVAGDNRLRLMFDDYVIPVGETARLDLRTTVKTGASGEFGMNLSAADIVAVFAGGPREGQAVTVATADGADIVLEEVYTTVDVSLAGSLTIKDNPFNPNLGPATFQYNLNRPGAVEFRVLSLIGEEVFSLHIPEGAPGASAGLQTIFWNGRNDDGLTVLNGVYIAVITSLRDRAQARMKVAVVK